MVQLRGKGSLNGLNLQATFYHPKPGANYDPEKHGRNLSVALDHRDPNAEGQRNLSLSTRTFEKDGEKRYSNTMHYADSQWQNMKEAGQVLELEDRDVVFLKADVIPVRDSKDTRGFAVRTSNEMGKSDFEADEAGYKGQFDFAKEAKAKAEAAKQAEAKEAETKEPEVKEPEEKKPATKRKAPAKKAPAKKAPAKKAPAKKAPAKQTEADLDEPSL